MPRYWISIAVGVDECNDKREVVVVIDDIGEIWHCLFSLVDRCMQCGGGVIYGINGMLPTAYELVYGLYLKSDIAYSGNSSSTHVVSSDIVFPTTMILSEKLAACCFGSVSTCGIGNELSSTGTIGWIE